MIAGDTFFSSCSVPHLLNLLLHLFDVILPGLNLLLQLFDFVVQNKFELFELLILLLKLIYSLFLQVRQVTHTVKTASCKFDGNRL